MPPPSRQTSLPPCRAIHIVQRMAPGGIETLALDLTRLSRGRDRVFSLEGKAADLVRAWPALQAIEGQLEAFARGDGITPGLILKLARRIRALRPDAVFVHHIGPLLYGGSGARLARAPRVIHVEHDAWHYDAPGRLRLAKSASRVLRPERIAVSDAIAARLQRIYPDARVTVIPPGIDTDRFELKDRSLARDRLALSSDWRIVGSAGRLVPVKAFDRLVAALAVLPASVHAVIAGDGPERAALEAQARQLGVADRLHLLGHRDDLEQVLPAFDLFCLPSLNEGLPRSVLEAQACGLPVVATAVGAMDQAIAPDAGLLVPPGDATALARAIAGVLARSISPYGPRMFVKGRFDLTRTAAAFDRAAGL
ncbi:MAG: glycosyltransferase [Proteobacteria bacterium]|nr:glycosyltransferase [Pseudomonadota bacterium]